MIIKIPDHIPGEKRRRKIIVMSIEYAMEKFDNSREDVAKFLGYSRRTLTTYLSWPELQHHRRQVPFDLRGVKSTGILETILRYRTLKGFLDAIKSKPAYTTLETEKQKNKFIKDMTKKYIRVKEDFENDNYR
jgi:hypothetical protein